MNLIEIAFNGNKVVSISHYHIVDSQIRHLSLTVAEDGFTTYYTDGIKEEVRTKAKNTADAAEILKRMTDMKQTVKWLLIFIGVAALVIGAAVLIARFM
jgi:negative regulator of sigma E activity